MDAQGWVRLEGAHKPGPNLASSMTGGFDIGQIALFLAFFAVGLFIDAAATVTKVEVNLELAFDMDDDLSGLRTSRQRGLSCNPRAHAP
jgi:hypothetical protein